VREAAIPKRKTRRMKRSIMRVLSRDSQWKRERIMRRRESLLVARIRRKRMREV